MVAARVIVVSRLVAVAVVLLAVISFVIAWRWSPAIGDDDIVEASSIPATSTAVVDARPQSHPSTEILEGLALRRPLHDAPPPPLPPPPPPPPLLLKLLGTVLDGDRSRAILQSSEGKSEFKRVGDRCGDAEVLRIEAGHVVVRYLGDEVTLKVEKPGGIQ